MALKFYFDEMMPRAVAEQLIARGVEVIMAVDVGMMGKKDPQHHEFAAANDAVMVTRDKPFAGVVSQSSDHTGLVCWTGADDDYGGMVRKFNNLAKANTFEAVRGKVFWLK
jgi:predicted nuclease of predicted toxin-antitoxin system